MTNDYQLIVKTQGPVGSGRYWTVTVELIDKNNQDAMMRFCFKTSTIGWRTLQHYRRTPLPWLGDLDSDDEPELIIWDSFPLSEEPVLSEYAMVAWVYRPTGNNKFTLDRKLSRRLAGELSAAYEEKIPGGDDQLRSRRTKASHMLDALAQRKCE